MSHIHSGTVTSASTHVQPQNFCREKVLSRESFVATYFCRERRRVLSWQTHVLFVATKMIRVATHISDSQYHNNLVAEMCVWSGNADAFRWRRLGVTRRAASPTGTRRSCVWDCVATCGYRTTRQTPSPSSPPTPDSCSFLRTSSISSPPISVEVCFVRKVQKERRWPKAKRMKGVNKNANAMWQYKTCANFRNYLKATKQQVNGNTLEHCTYPVAVLAYLICLEEYCNDGHVSSGNC